MTTRLFLLSAPPPTGPPRFGEESPLDARTLSRAAELRPSLPSPSAGCRTAPSPRCRALAGALGLAAETDESLRDLDVGGWRGRALSDVAASDPEGLAVWTTDPDAAPHGGEPVTSLCARVAARLESLPDHPGAVLAVVPPAVVRAAVLHALNAPATAFWRVDVEPLSVTSLTHHATRWHIRLT
ncbi:histidine phosphatase family protein [Streptomyces sp. MUM 203J]|uniref:histidine phosphatase family protein n=1 Tax=Streptomyces sp. MUM 203J TaxID=2791990 RepID=UPI001F037544|nr:histidine phosphatase family protein [Streptomyces sp. MUM 203J]MCH0538913.1 histidine phosphatase family protein [Streptomyces sp. MUM 203J]